MSEAIIDVEYLLNNPGSAVRCETIDEAKHFIAYMKEHYPDLCESWHTDETRFDHGNDEGIGYTFYWMDSNDNWLRDSLMYGSILSLRIDDYTIIDFWELMNTNELNESDKPIESLFGG